MPNSERHFHLHLISDSTGETLIAASRAVSSQFENTSAVEHIHSFVRNRNKLQEVMTEIDTNPGIVLFTIADDSLSKYLQETCRKMGIPCVSILEPIFNAFQTYLGTTKSRKSGAQHELNSDYFNRIEALDFTLLHDDGALPDDINEADIILLGISRTSKTPTSIYLANRGIKTVNYPLVTTSAVPEKIVSATRPLVVALIATTDRIQQIRQNRQLAQNNMADSFNYTNRAAISEELAMTRKLCIRHGWNIIDVSRKSIEETAAEILELLQEFRKTSSANSARSDAKFNV
jgi:regulator of PEP synthase PpsR (kinase-PPPase family)